MLLLPLQPLPVPRVQKRSWTRDEKDHYYQGRFYWILIETVEKNLRFPYLIRSYQSVKLKYSHGVAENELCSNPR